MSSPSRGRVVPILFFLTGWPMLVLGACCLALSFVCHSREFLPIISISYGLCLGGIWIIKLAIRRVYPGAEVCMQADSRAPILYLRPFDDDQSREENWFQTLIAGPDALILPTSEEKIARELGRLGPVIAIGRPEERVPPLGASRMYFTDDTWQAGIRQHIPSSRLILLRAGTTQGLQWEFGALRELAKPEQVIIHLPFKRTLLGKGKELAYQAFKSLAEPAFGSAFPAKIGKAQFLYFDADWQVQVAKKRGLGPIIKTPRTLRGLLRSLVPRPWPKNEKQSARHHFFGALNAGLSKFFYTATFLGLLSVAFMQHERMLRERWNDQNMSNLLRGYATSSADRFENQTPRGALIRWFEGPAGPAARADASAGPFYKIYGARSGFKIPMGIMDWNGDTLIPTIYASVGNFSSEFEEDLVPVNTGYNTWGYFNTRGELEHTLAAAFAGDFSDGLARIEFEDDRWGYINRAFELALPAIYSDAYDFEHGLALVQKPEALFLGWHFIDREGNLAIEGDFAGSFGFHEGIAVVIDEDFRASYYNLDGTQPFEKSFDAGCSFREGLALVQENELWGVIDTHGEYVIEARLDYEHEALFDMGMDTSNRHKWHADIGFANGLLPAQADGKWGFIDRSGAFVIAPSYRFAQPFYDQVAWVQNAAEQWGLIDTQEQLLIPHTYGAAYPFRDGRARVYPPDAIIDKAGATIR